MKAEIKVIITKEEIQEYKESYKEFNYRYPTPKEIAEEFIDSYIADRNDFNTTYIFHIEG